MNTFRKAVASTAIAGLTLVRTASVASAQPTALPPAIASIEGQLTPEETERLQNLSPAEEQKFDILSSLSGPSFIDQIARYFTVLGLVRLADLVRQIFGGSLGSPAPTDPNGPVAMGRLRAETANSINSDLDKHGVLNLDYLAAAQDLAEKLETIELNEAGVASIKIEEESCHLASNDNEYFTRLAPILVRDSAHLAQQGAYPKNSNAWSIGGDDKSTVQIQCSNI